MTVLEKLVRKRSDQKFFISAQFMFIERHFLLIFKELVKFKIQIFSL